MKKVKKRMMKKNRRRMNKKLRRKTKKKRRRESTLNMESYAFYLILLHLILVNL